MSIELRELFPKATWIVGHLAEDGDNVLDTERLVHGKNSDNKTLAYLAEKKVEDGRTLDIIYTHPQWVNNGTIKGFFPWVPLPDNALFETELGFISVPKGGKSIGKVNFQVWEHHYENNQKVWNKIANVPKEYSRSLKKISVSLDHLKKAGIQSISIELRVDAGDTSAHDLAVWVHPRIIDSAWEASGIPKKLTIKYKQDKQPLKHFYVAETNGLNADVVMRRTDENGHVFISPNEDSIRVYYQNNVARMLSPYAFNPEFSQSFWNVSDGDVFELGSNKEERDALDVAIRSNNIYKKVWRHVYPFNQPGRGTFPYGHAKDINSTRNMQRRFEILYPDTLNAHLSWVDPANLLTGIPFMHLKNKSDHTLAHELAHAFHFASLPVPLRHQTRTDYFWWLVSEFFKDGQPYHGFSIKTTPFIAFVESIGIFAERYYNFAKDKPSDKNVKQLQQEFITAEKKSSDYKDYKGDDIEGAVYGAIFVDFASRVGFDLAIGAYFMCRELSFSGYRKQVKISNRFLDSQKKDLDKVARDWGF